MVKYALIPGPVRSRHDSDIHFISAPELCRLYGVKMSECAVFDMDDRNIPCGLIELLPRYLGDYREFAKLKGIK